MTQASDALGLLRLAVSEKDSLLVVGRRGMDEKQLAVFLLDPQGQPTATPTWITLPKPESLAANFTRNSCDRKATGH